MKWTSHYTGTQTLEFKHLYVRRNTGSKTINFIRIQARRFSLGAFFGRLNYSQTFQYKARGIELFLMWRGIDVGTAIFLPAVKPQVGWSGSPMEPYSACILAAGPVMIRFRTPKWLKVRKEAVDRALYLQQISCCFWRRKGH